jgi:hypothetical protein
MTPDEKSYPRVHPTPPPSDPGVDREFVKFAADDLHDMAENLQGLLVTLRGLISTMRQTAATTAHRPQGEQR